MRRMCFCEINLHSSRFIKATQCIKFFFRAIFFYDTRIIKNKLDFCFILHHSYFCYLMRNNQLTSIKNTCTTFYIFLKMICDSGQFSLFLCNKQSFFTKRKNLLFLFKQFRSLSTIQNNITLSTNTQRMGH